MVVLSGNEESVTKVIEPIPAKIVEKTVPAIKDESGTFFTKENIVKFGIPLGIGLLLLTLVKK